MPGVAMMAAVELPAELESSISSEYPGQIRAFELCRAFAAHADPHHPSFLEHVSDLIETARGQRGETWEVRRLAALLLELQTSVVLCARPDQAGVVLAALGLKSLEEDHVDERLLEEGFTTTELREFTDQLKSKLQRRQGTGMFPQRLSRGDWEDLFHRAKQECRLTLGRYLFTPAEVAARILSQVAVSAGVRDETRIGPPEEQAIDAPPYECEIVRELAGNSRIFWVSDDTPACINSLVEFPLGTVALVIKPPGSDVEIELKRAGMRRRPLDALFEEGIYPVPYTHRMQGGSPAGMLLAEAQRAAFFRSFYRAVHSGEEPSMSKIIATAHVHAVPAPHGELDLLTYFTDPRAFGPGFARMRDQLTYCVRHSPRGRRPVPTGDLALTVEFLRQIKPRQSIVIRTSSFRLDVLYKYLSPQGPEIYFGDGLHSTYTPADARRLAEDLLEEVLGSYCPPEQPFRGYDEHIAAAFDIASNRVAADRSFVACMEQIGLYWGTLLAAGGHTSGESFVARNIGLKSSWANGRWHARCIFMDHDSLFCPDRDNEEFYVEAFLNGAFLDQRYVFGNIREEDSVLGSVECLQQIYRVGTATAQRGDQALCESMAGAYRKVRTLMSAGRLERFMSRPVTASLSHFDHVVRMLLAIDQDTGHAPWEGRAQKWMTEIGYGNDLSRKFVKLIRRNESFLRANHYLFQI